MRRLMLLLATVMGALLASITFAQGDGAQQASAVLYNPSGEEIGFARFTEDATGVVHVNVHVKGLRPGRHGTHIHTVGVCDGTTTPPFVSAEGHFNPFNRQHGLDNPDGPHAGDLPNLTVNRAGVGHLNTTTSLVSLSDGPASLFDGDRSALVIHADPDDHMTHPTGNSGGRIACGVITASP